MKKMLKILRNQAIDSSDEKLINALKNEAEIERSNEDENTEFDIVCRSLRSYQTVRQNLPL